MYLLPHRPVALKNRQPRLQIGMVYIADVDEEDNSHQAIEHHPPAPPQPRVVWHLDDGPTTSHLEYHLSDNEGEHAHKYIDEGLASSHLEYHLSERDEEAEDAYQYWMIDAHQWHHWEDDYWHEWEEEEGEE